MGGVNRIQSKFKWRIHFIILLLYVSTVLWFTVLKRSIGLHSAQFELFWSYKKWIDGDTDLGREIVANMAMFAPFGYLLSYLVNVARETQKSVFKDSFRILVAAGAFSLSIETLQLLLMRGVFEWDDVVSNTVGAAAGIIIYNVIKHLKYLPEMISVSFIAVCVGVIYMGNNVTQVEADITPRLFCFQVDEVSAIDSGYVQISGFAFRYEHATTDYDIFLRPTGEGKTIKLKTYVYDRPDVDSHFSCEYDYTSSGFTAIGRVQNTEYEVMIRWPWSIPLSTGVYITGGSIHYASQKEFKAPDIDAEFVKSGTLRVYRPDCHCWIYQYQGCLYWIADSSFEFEDDRSTYIQYQLYTTQKNRLPANRRENGWFWDNIGGFFEDYTVNVYYGPYRVMKRRIPTSYSVTAIVTGYHKNGQWIWKQWFRPIY